MVDVAETETRSRRRGAAAGDARGMSGAEPRPRPEPVPDPHPDAAAPAMGFAAGAVRTARPRQWIKNLLVFAAPGAAGVLTHGTVLGRSLVAFAIFCLAASATYFMNDAFDRDVDRLHPDKRHRPVAAGVVGRRAAALSAALLLAGSIGLGVADVGPSVHSPPPSLNPLLTRTPVPAPSNSPARIPAFPP